MAKTPVRIEAFDLTPGLVIAGRYRVEGFLGRGWEGEAYRVSEVRTGVIRAAKLFYPHRNERDRALRACAQKLSRLQGCDIVTQYHHAESFRFRSQPVSLLVSELVDGEVLEELVRRQPGKRLPPYAALRLLHVLTAGISQIHARREYHGDIHDRNVLVRRRGVEIEAKLVEVGSTHEGKRTGRFNDVMDLIRILYDATGGAKRYAAQPPEIKAICCGLRRGLIRAKFPTADRLLRHLETFGWRADTPV